ncbi:MAG: hypothetical protein H7329_13050 [Opitutaceae bacterium]|nr:hypothetical protein [Cytophagales bacterium]
MKKLIFTGILSLSTLLGFAQKTTTTTTTTSSSTDNSTTAGPSAGSLFVFGSIGVTSQKPAGNNTTSGGYFSFAPGAGYFLTDRIALGARLTFGKQFGGGVQGGSTFGIQAFGRYYFLRDMFASKGGFFLEGNIGYSATKPAYYNNNYSNAYYYNGSNGNNYYYSNGYYGNGEPKTISTFTFGVGPGFALFPTKKIGFEFTFPNILGFYVSSRPYDGQSGASGINVGLSSISLPSVTFMYFIK